MAIVSVVNEGSSSTLTITFLDAHGAVFAPSAATYQVHDDESLVLLQAETPLPGGSSVDVELSAEVNAIMNDCNPVETRVVTIKASLGSEALTEEYRYKVKNLRFVI